MSSMGSSSACDESSEADPNHGQEDFAFPLSDTNSLLSLSKRIEELIIESLHKAWPVQEPVRLSSLVENKLSVKERVEVLDQRAADDEVQVAKERFSKLLLGEDMSGSGKGVSSAVAISNAITNLYATVFGNCHKLKPLPVEKKIMWQREMDCLLSVCEYIVELFPASHSLPDGTKLEVMATKARSDISINLPALEQLEGMLLAILDDFEKTEFWYVDEKKTIQEDNAVSPLTRVPQRNVDKWWVPVPCVPECGLSKEARQVLIHSWECASQIHKAALAINCSILADMEVPDSYTQALPKSGRACVGDSIYRYMSTLDRFSAENLLERLEISSEHEVLALANCMEAAMYVWQRKARPNKSKPSWSMVKEFMDASDKNFVLATRAQSLLLSLRHHFPALPQSRLDTSKIQHNKDVGQAILESYSRVLESLAHCIVSLIDDVLSIDASLKQQREGKSNDGVSSIQT